jgi:putative ABC transport system substrate-binding protein
LVRLQVDVIVASGLLLSALKRATPTIPIVMAAAPDPVRDGFVQSLAHPGGNFTGLSLGAGQTRGLTGKRLQLLKELAPGAALLAVLWDRSGRRGWEAAEAVARQQGWKLLSIELRDAREIEGAFKAATTPRVGGLLVYADALLFDRARRIAELDKILKGANPATLPVEQPTKFELVINLKAAESIGLTIPQSVLLQANELIQ